MSNQIDLSFAKEHQSRLRSFSKNEQQLRDLGKMKVTLLTTLRSRAPTQKETKTLPVLKPQAAEQ